MYYNPPTHILPTTFLGSWHLIVSLGDKPVSMHRCVGWWAPRLSPCRQFSRHLLLSSRPRAPSTQTGNPSLFLFWTPAVQTTTTSQRDEGNDQGSHVRVKVYYWLACWWCQHMWGHCWDHIYDIGASNAFVYNHLQIENFNTRQAGQKLALTKKTYESLHCHSR